MQDWSMQVWKLAGMQVCKYDSMQECKNAICYLLTESFYLKLAITCKNFFLPLVVVRLVFFFLVRTLLMENSINISFLNIPDSASKQSRSVWNLKRHSSPCLINCWGLFLRRRIFSPVTGMHKRVDNKVCFISNWQGN